MRHCGVCESAVLRLWSGQSEWEAFLRASPTHLAQLQMVSRLLETRKLRSCRGWSPQPAAWIWSPELCLHSPSRRLPPPPPSQHPPCRRRVCIHPLFQAFITHLLTAFSVSTFAAGPRLEALGFDLPTAQCYSVETATAQQTVMWHRIERPLGGFREPFLMTAGDKLCYGAKT